MTAVRAEPALAAATPRRREGVWAWFASAVSLVAAGTLAGSRTLVPDSLYELYDGRYILRHGLPHHNLATLAARGAATVDEQWLGHLMYYAAWQLGGYQALAVVSAALVTCGYAILGLVMLRRGIPPAGMFRWTVAAFAVSVGNNVVEAQSFGYLFFAVTLWLLVTDDRQSTPRRRTWLLVPILMLWANTHGSVVLGAAAVAWYAALQTASALRRRDRGAVLAYLTLAACCAVACVCTPYGTETIRYYLAFASRGHVLAPYNLAFHAPGIAYPLCWAFFGLAAAVVAGTAVAWRRGVRPDLFLGGLAVMMLCLALTAVRYQVWFGFAGSLLAADSLSRAADIKAAMFGAAFRRVTAGVLAAVALASLGILASSPASVLASGFPVHAIDKAAGLAARDPAARVLGDDWSSTPMLWLHPAVFGRVGFDIRIEQYTPAQLREYFDFLELRGPDWPAMASDYNIIVVSRRSYPGLAAAVSRLRAWQVIYADRQGLVAVRR